MESIEKEMAEQRQATSNEGETTIQRVGPFEMPVSDTRASGFARLLDSQFEAYRDKIGLPGLSEQTNGVELRSLPETESRKVVQRFAQKFAPGHAERFGVEIKGVFTTSRFDQLPADLDNQDIWFHGTDAARGTSILAEGFKVPETRKVDAHPMYGTGVALAQDSSKSMGYFHVDGYNDRDSNEGGVIFMVVPHKKDTFTAEAPLWGDAIRTPDGQTIKWQEKFDSVFALSRQDSGGSERYDRPNYRELTLRSGEQAHGLVALWCRLVPATDPRHDKQNPVIYNPNAQQV